MTQKEKGMSVDLLNQLLANGAVMLFQVLNFHWNIVGKEFHDYHILFDKMYKQLFEDMDLLAERVRAVGGQALGSMQACLKVATLTEEGTKVPNPEQMIVKLLQHHEYYNEQIREAIAKLEKNSDDYGTRKMLEDLIERYEKIAWMLRSLLGKK